MRKKFQKKSAEIISLVLNPIFVILLLILLGIEKSNLPQTNLMIFTVFALILNGLFPSSLVIYFSRKGMILDDVLENKEVLKNRPFFLAWGALVLLLEVGALYFFKKPQPLFAILMALFFLTLAIFLISLYRKISLHVAFVTAFTLIILFLFGYPFWPFLFLILITIWSRFSLKRHTKKQMFAAFILATVVVSLVFYFFGLFYIPTS